MAGEFVTADLQLSSFLVSIGHELVRVEGTPDRRVFVFAAVPQEDVRAYYSGTHPVAPHRLFTAYRALKRQLFQPV